MFGFWERLPGKLCREPNISKPPRNAAPKMQSLKQGPRPHLSLLSLDSSNNLTQTVYLPSIEPSGALATRRAERCTDSIDQHQDNHGEDHCREQARSTSEMLDYPLSRDVFVELVQSERVV